MPYQVNWDDIEQSIILCKAEGRWTWDEYHHALDQIVQLANSVQHRVDVINVRSDGSVMPSGLGIPHYRRAERIMPANVGLNILVTGNKSATRGAGIMMAGLMRNLISSVTILSTQEEAQAFIAEERAALSHFS